MHSLVANPVHPGIQLRIASKTGKVFPYLYKNVLYQVIRVVMVNNHTANVPVNLLLIFFQQQVKCLIPGLFILKLA